MYLQARLAYARGSNALDLAKSCVDQLDGLVDDATLGIVFVSGPPVEMSDEIVRALKDTAAHPDGGSSWQIDDAASGCRFFPPPRRRETSRICLRTTPPAADPERSRAPTNRPPRRQRATDKSISEWIQGRPSGSLAGVETAFEGRE